MSWWGYWTGLTPELTNGATQFLDQNQAEAFGANTISVHIDRAGNDLGTIHDVLAKAQTHGVKVVLIWSSVLSKDCGIFTPANFDNADYVRWDDVMKRAAAVFSDVKDAIAAMVGFDDMNRRPWCFNAVPGVVSPVQESLRVLASYFPTVQYRGHIWQIHDWATDGGAQPAMLPEETMLFPYSYQRDGAQSVSVCPHEGTFPGRTLADGTDARKTVDDIKGFLSFVNETPASRNVPILFLPSATHFGTETLPLTDRGIGCTQETLWYYARCQALPSGDEWARRTVGFLPFNYNSNYQPGWQWTGVDRSPELQTSGQWIGANKTCSFESRADFRKDTTQGARGWRYQTCAADPVKNVVRSCKDFNLFSASTRDGSWVNPTTGASVWDTGQSPPKSKRKGSSRTWVAPAAGHVHVDAHVAVAAPTVACSATDDGSLVSVFAGKRVKVWPAGTPWNLVTATSLPVDFSFDITVVAGTPITFVEHRNGLDASCDAVRWVIDLDFTE